MGRVLPPPGGDLFFAVSALADVALAVGVVLVFRRLGLAWAAGAAILAFGVWRVKLSVLRYAGLDGFGFVHVVWLDLVVAVPVAGLVLLLRRGAHRPSRAVGALAVVLAPVGVYASFIEPARVEVERAELPLGGERDGRRPLRVGVLSDLQFSRVGGHERRAVRRLRELRPDVVLIPGDLHQGSREELGRELPAIRRLLGELRPPGGVYFAPGDQESVAEAELVLRGTGIRLLVDREASVRVGDRRLAVLGLDLRPGGTSGRAALRRFERRRDRGELGIVMAHRPDWVRYLGSDGRIDLLVAGHTHGGQVQVPYAGPPTIASRVPREVGAGGLHVVEGRRVYVSRGVGVERGQAPKLRLGAPPEVSLLTLR